MIRNGLPDPDSDPDRHQTVISWSLGHTPALHKISSKSIDNFFDNPVNADFGLRSPGSGRWSRSSPKLNSLVPGPCPTPPRNFVKISSQLFQLSNWQTNRQTDQSENITSFGRGNKLTNINQCIHCTYTVLLFAPECYRHGEGTVESGGTVSSKQH